MINTVRIEDWIVEGVDTGDCPDFSDAFISAACWDSGDELTDAELDELNDKHREFVLGAAMESMR